MTSAKCKKAFDKYFKKRLDADLNSSGKRKNREFSKKMMEDGIFIYRSMR